MALADRVRDELRKDGIQLWLPPYTSDSAALQALGHEYEKRLGVASGDVEVVLVDLQLHAVSKLKAKTRITLLCRVLGRPELREEFDIADTGAAVRARMSELLGAHHVKIIAGGRVMRDEPLVEQGWATDASRNGPLRVLILVQATPTQEAAAVSDPHLDRCPVAVLREAAKQLTATGFGDFELSDAKTGELVPLPQHARQALVTAVALHAKGRELMARRSERGEAGIADALEFWVEADSCFEQCRENAAQLLSQLDNYGQLQLDICWAYALLGDTSRLPDALLRLQAAEAMMQRQVDKNFLTIAEVQAEQGRTLPPELIAPARLLLLRGIAKQCCGEASTDLNRAALLLRGLRVNEASVSELMMLGTTRLQAVAALRRSGGVADRAAEQLMNALPQQKVSRQKREAQLALGQTADGSFVSQQCLEELIQMGATKQDALKALKQSNNDVERALRLLQQEQTVDEVALAKLLSMGFEQEAAEAALRVNSDVDAVMALPHDAAACSNSQALAKVDEALSPGTAVQQRTRDSESLDAAREIVERELGRCLRRTDLDDDVAGATLEEEEALVQQYLSRYSP